MRIFNPILLVSAVFTAVSSCSAAPMDSPSSSQHVALKQALPKVQTSADLAGFVQQRFSVLTTELSPAILVQCRDNTLGLFRNLQRWGLSAPLYAAVPAQGGMRIIKRGESLSMPMSEAWLLCWFNKAEGWSRWDVPMLLVLQHRPKSITLDSSGLNLRFAGSAGITAVMPLYGYQKIPFTPQEGFGAGNGLKGCGVSTEKWAAPSGFPAPVLARCRLFARMLRSIPVHCKEEYQIDGDDLVVRSSLDWLPIRDDWNTQPSKLAPIAPTLALAWWCGGGNAGANHKPFPMTFSQPVRDMDLFTQYGPYAGIENVDSYTVRMPVLQYVNTVHRSQVPQVDEDSQVGTVLRRLRSRMDGKFKTTDWQQIWDHGGPSNYCWQITGDRWYAKAVPYLAPDSQDRVKTVLVDYMRNYVLDESRYKPFKDTLLLVGPGIGTWGGYDDAGKFSSNVIETLWDIASNAGGWDLVKERWSIVRRLFITPLEADWKSVGRNAIAEMGDEGGPAIAMARLAHHVGDTDTYAFACYVAARELVHHYVKQVGIEYFRMHQPWVSSDPFPQEVYLTNMLGDLASWRIDGPGYPTYDHERQYANRWVRFSSEDVAEFYHQVLPAEVKAEMDLLTQRATEPSSTYKLSADAAHIAPSIVRLRGMLLHEPANTLVALSPPDKWQRSRVCETAAMSLPVLWNAVSWERTRLIEPLHTDYTLGLERAVDGGFPGLDLAVEASASSSAPDGMRGFPFLRWWGWRSPEAVNGLPNGRYLSFGQIVPGFTPTAVNSRRVNWNTQIMLFADK